MLHCVAVVGKEKEQKNKMFISSNIYNDASPSHSPVQLQTQFNENYSLVALQSEEKKSNQIQT